VPFGRVFSPALTQCRALRSRYGHGASMPVACGYIMRRFAPWRLSTVDDRHYSTLHSVVIFVSFVSWFFIDSIFVNFLSNVVAGGVMGYVGVSTGRLGVPFVNPYYLYNFRNPAIIGGAVYGALGGALAMLGGKSI
jgi:hypothetical protein